MSFGPHSKVEAQSDTRRRRVLTDRARVPGQLRWTGLWSETRIQPGSLRAWIIAIRPQTLPAAIAPVVVGASCARHTGHFRWLPGLVTLVTALVLQITANLANDVFDHERGADRVRLGPTRVVEAGLLSARTVKHAVLVALAIALLFGTYLASVGGWPIVVIGLLAMACSVAYTAGPYPLGYHGLGDVCVLSFFGLVAVPGTAYLVGGQASPLAFWLSLPVGCLTTAILVVNNLRDHERDAQVGKRTLAVRLGRKGSIVEYRALLSVAYLVPMLLVLAGESIWLLLPLSSLPCAWRIAVGISSETGTALNRRLAQTAELLLGYSLLLAAGLLVAASG